MEEQHFAAVTTPSEIGGILRAIDGYMGTFVVRSAFRLAPLVFVRPGELRKAKWQDINLDEATWLLELSKGDDSKGRRDDVDKYLIVPLSSQSVEILRALHALTGGDIYVFPGARDRNRPMSENAILTAMRRMGISKDEMCGHGFRATARTASLAEDQASHFGFGYRSKAWGQLRLGMGQHFFRLLPCPHCCPQDR